MRQVSVVTVARSDYSILRPLLRRINEVDDLNLHLIAAGTHLVPEFGRTIDTIADDNFVVADKVEMLLSSDTPEGIAKSMAIGVMGFAQSFGRFQPDLLVLTGDRFEMFAAAVAALPFGVPIAHIHGGELSEGAIDDAMRHSITKLSHLHFVSNVEAQRRVIQMGEAPWRVTLSGAPALDNLREMDLIGPEELAERFDLEMREPPMVVTFHPTTLKYAGTEAHTQALLDALRRINRPVVFTYPNADTSGHRIITMIENFAAAHKHAQVVINLGPLGYYSLLANAAAMVGNSSSGIIEAASFALPVVNIGERQRGRLCGSNVIHVAPDTHLICLAIERALSKEFRDQLRGMSNPYGNGRASERIIERLCDVPLDEELISKRFHDLPAAMPDTGEALRGEFPSN